MVKSRKGGFVSLLRLRRTRPRHAVESDWRRSGRRLSRRALLIVGAVLTAGPLTYLLLPVPSAAEPGTVQPAPVVAPAPVRTPALIGGMIGHDDLLTDPIGVVVGSPNPAADGELIGWPVSDHTPSSGFGYRSDPFTHRQRWHDGIDLGQACGDPAWASLDGTVAYAGWAGGYGNRVILRHADRGGLSFETTYNHLGKIEVSVGQVVQRGYVIGRVGSTGRSTACHMHFEVILDGSYVDPMRFLTGDQSKAGLSRKVGSHMPSGLPSPTASEALSTPTSSASASRTPTPSPSRTSPSPTSPTPTPTVTSPTPTPTVTSPSPTATCSTPTPNHTVGTECAGPTAELSSSDSASPSGTESRLTPSVETPEEAAVSSVPAEE